MAMFLNQIFQELMFYRLRTECGKSFHMVFETQRVWIFTCIPVLLCVTIPKQIVKWIVFWKKFRLKEWLSKKVSQEKERDRERQERIARRRALPNHKFDDPLYDQQKQIVSENQQDAFTQGNGVLPSN